MEQYPRRYAGSRLTYIVRTVRPELGAASVQVLIAYTRKCQAIAKQPCLVTERATENDGCNSSLYGWDVHVYRRATRPINTCAAR